MPEKPIRHIVFGISAAGSLRQALNLSTALDDKRVLGCPDDLSYGPINPPDPVARIAWLNRQLGHNEEDWSSEERKDDQHYWSGRIVQFWTDALDPDIHPVIWVCRRCAQEFAGFLELVHRLGDAPCDVIDVTDLVIDIRRSGEAVFHQQVRSFGEVHPRHMIDQSLWGRRTALSDDDRAKWSAMWRACQNENAPLRIVEADILVSVLITYFDDFLLSFARPEWMKSAWIVGEAWGDEDRRWPYRQISDLILWFRLRQLALAGRLDHRGDINNIRTSEMRLPTS